MKTKKDILSCRTCIYRQLLFKDLNDFEYKLVNNSRTERLYRRGEVIKTEGDLVESFMYLRKGLVKLFKTDSNGKDHILSINRPGDFISLLSIFADEPYRFSIAALEETFVCDVKLDVLKHLIETNGRFAIHLLKKTSQISNDIIENQFEQAQKQVKGRVAHLLLFFSNHVYHKNEFLLPLTRREMGELISITTENTIRTFSEFRKDGIIDQQGKTIKILDYDRLTAINKGG